jgi:hypothetical protein
MEKEAQNFLKAEETAVKLVETLKQLHTEATSYQTATQELNIVRGELLQLIESIEKTAVGSYDIIKLLREIGGPEILSRLINIENILAKEFNKQKSFMDKIKRLITITIIISIVTLVLDIVILLIK